MRRSGADANYAARDKIARISVALSLDLDDGVSDPIFKAKKLSHGKRFNSAVLRSRTTIAIALDFAIEAKAKADVLEKISKIPGIKELLSKGAAAEKSPLNWRTRLHEGFFLTDLVREQWHDSRKFIAELTGSPSDKRKIFKAAALRLIAAAT